MNIFIEVIFVRNDDKQIVKISRNYRLNYFIELDYFNAIFVNDDNVDLIIKTSRIIHKISWFKKIIVIFVTTLIVIIIVVTSTQSIIFVISLTIHIESISFLISVNNVEISNLSQTFILFNLSQVFTNQIFDFTKRLKFSITFITSSSNIVLFNNITIYFFDEAKVSLNFRFYKRTMNLLIYRKRLEWKYLLKQIERIKSLKRLRCISWKLKIVLLSIKRSTNYTI